MTYAIFEGNVERLQKKLTRISNKCLKYGCSFKCVETGEEFRSFTDEEGFTTVRRYVLFDVEGEAKINDWELVASVDETEKGNVFRKVSDVEIPVRYFECAPKCEHCGTNRRRTHTYIVHNVVTDEFKQVGKACLCDFTHGLSAAAAAEYLSWFEDVAEFEAPVPGGVYRSFTETKVIARFIAETIRRFGYCGSESGYPTKRRALNYYHASHGAPYSDENRREMAKVGFDAESAESKELVEKVFAWVASAEGNGDWIHNLKVVCASEYVEYKHVGILASAFPAYNKKLERDAEESRRLAEAAGSDWVGEVGKRVKVSISDFRVLTSWETQFGITCVYRIVDEGGNVFTWKCSGSGIRENHKTLVGTIKAHSEYHGEKQTELTRCRSSVA